MKTPTIALLLMLSALLAACAGSPPVPLTAAATRVAATAAPTPVPTALLEKVTVNYGLDIPLIMLLPLDLAQALDLYKQEGLDITINRSCGCGSRPMAESLQTGHSDFAGLGIDGALLAQGGQHDLQMVFAFTRFFDFQLLVRSDMHDKIKTLPDLKGQKVTYYGALPSLLPYLMAKAGLKLGDVQFVNGGLSADLPAAMQSGNWVAITSAEPYAAPLVKSGKAYALVDLGTEADAVKWVGGEFPDLGLVATTDTVKNRPQTVQKMTNALVKALRYMATHSAPEIAAVLPQAVTGNDKALFVEALEHDTPALSKDGTATEAGVKNVVEVDRALGLILPEQQVDIGALYTNVFVNNVK